MLKKEKISSPLVERILTIGVSSDELLKFFNQKKINISEVTNLKIKILEEYKSNDLKESINDNYIENITIVTYSY